LSSYLVDVLALKLGKELVETLLVGLNSNGAENGLDVLSGRRGVAGQAEEKVCCEVLHCDFVCLIRDSRLAKVQLSSCAFPAATGFWRMFFVEKLTV